MVLNLSQKRCDFVTKKQLKNHVDFESLCDELVRALEAYATNSIDDRMYCDRLIDYVRSALNSSQSEIQTPDKSINWQTVAENLWEISNYYFDRCFDFTSRDAESETKYSAYMDSIEKLFEIQIPCVPMVLSQDDEPTTFNA